MPEDATYILESCPDCHGFYGASSMERLPTERAIAEQTRQFKRIARPPQQSERGGSRERPRERPRDQLGEQVAATARQKRGR